MFARYRKSPPSSGQLNNNNSPNPKGGSQHAKFNSENNDAISTAIQANNKDQAEKIRIESAAAAAASLEELRTKLDRLEYLTDKIAPKPPPQQSDKKDAAQKGKINTDAIAAGTMRSSMLLTEDIAPSDSTAAEAPADDNMDKFTEKYPMQQKEKKDNIKIAMKSPQQEEEKVKRSPSAQAADLLANSNAYFLSISYEDEVEIVELLRRIAELVVLSERRAGQLLAEVVSTGESMDELDEDEGEENVGEGSGENDDSRTVQSKGESTGESPAADKSTQPPPPPAPEALLSSKKSKAAEKRKQKQQYNEDMAFPYLAIFELFCERNGLANIVNIVTGVAFQVEEIAASQDDEGVAPIKGKSTKIQDVVLPPLSIATQAVQSISILIQNVSRATSLYFLLSNNRVNDLIKLPLHLYSRAEMNALNDAKKSPRKSIRGRNKQQQQEMNSEMSELSTHFVSFLKSLAMRVNSETLQFFLSFPLNENCTKEESTTTTTTEEDDDPSKLLNYLDRRKVVEFPLYLRALEFCSQDHDSFVRVTAMNVCMNIIRLVTINSNEDIMNDGQMQGDDSENDSTDGKANESQHKSLPTATPSGMLHDSPTLPLQDRIAIAQYACHPTRVSDLVSPVCARLTSQFGQVEGTLRALEESSSDITNSTSPQSAKKPSKKKEDPARLRSTIQDLIANVQDELLLLDDLLKVGLISLNEQAIEMLFATFVYPMLLQPLLLPLHRFSSSKNKTEEGEESLVSKKPTITLQSPMPFSTDDNDTDVIDQDDENDNKAEATATPQSVKGEATSDTPNSPTAPTSTPDDTSSGNKQTYSSCDMDLSPSKTALFGLSVIFHTVSNPTFRHLLLTALLHPQSPEASGGVVITTPPQVTLPARSKTGDSGTSKFQLEVRSERNQERQSKDSEDFQQHVNVYTFGTEPGVAKDDDVDSGSSCVFILAPALVDMLRNNTSLADGIKDMQITHPNTRPNPYRAILMSSISGSDDMVSLQSLATAALHAAVSLVDGSIVQKIMFPGSTGHLTSNTLDPSNDDVVKETLRCLCKGIVNTSVTYDGWWKIKFNTVAAKTLMDMIDDNHDCIRFVETIVGDIRIKAAEYLMTLPSLLDGKSREGDSSSNTPNKKTGDRQHLDNWLLDRFFFDQADKYTNSVVENVCYLKEHINDDSDAKEQYRYGIEVLTSISITTTSALLCEDTSVVDNMLVDTKSTPFYCAASWALASLYLDAFCVKLSKMSSAMVDTEQSEEDGEVKNIPHRSLSYISATNSGDDDSTVGRALAHISSKFAIAMLDEGESSDKKTAAPVHGAAVGLVGKAAFPCVCEVSNAFSSLFTGRTCISNEGISWQSLYLVVVGKWAVLAEPGHGGTGGEGRVITACRLACLAVKKDSSPLANNKTPARRLLVAHASLDPRPPSLFLVDSTTSRRGGPSLGSNGLRLTRSRMDLWFEDANAANHACKVLSAKIAKARAKRGSRIGSALLTK